MKSKLKQTKKVHSIVLAAAFTVQSVLATPIFAENIKLDSVSDVSSFEINVNLDFPVSEDKFDITLSSSDGAGNFKECELRSNENGNVVSGIIKDIPVGKYILIVKSESYADYIQEVNITKGVTTKIELNNSKQRNELKKNSSDNLYGVMAIGDVNADGIVDEKDSDAVMQAIENGNSDSKFDLNNDNTVDIADLSYITLNYGSNVEAKPLGIISSENIKPEKGDGTVIKAGNMDSLTENVSQFVQFAPLNGQAISASNPIELSLDINQQVQAENRQVNGVVIKPPVGSLNLIKSGVVTIEDDDGKTYFFDIGEDGNLQLQGLSDDISLGDTSDRVSIERDGTVVINIGRQIAVKKVTIVVTGASTNLVDIAKVEFVNNMEDRISEPDYSIPDNIVLEQLSAGENPSFKVTWKPQVNVTGYEVHVSSNGKEIIQTSNTNSVTISSLVSEKLAAYEPYTIRVRSVNGSWKSPYSESAEITLKPNSLPPAPEYVSAVGQTESIKVSWRKMRDTQYYSLFYREKGTGDYSEIKNISDVSYVIVNLKPSVTYEVYVVGHNELGSSPASVINEATAFEAKDVEMPKYKLINTSNGAGQTTNHIKNVQVPSGAQLIGGHFAVVDDNSSTYTAVNDWDTGVVYSNFSNPIVTLDKKYTIDTIRFAPSASQQYTYSGAKIRYIGDDGKWYRVENCTISRKKDKNNNVYYTVTADKPITSDIFQLCVTTGYSRMVTISEMKFYYYDDLTSRINALYEDSMHLKLKSEVTEQSIADLEDVLNIKDSVSGELHPDYDSLKKELEYARELLNTGALADIIKIDTSVTPKTDGHTDFAMSLSNYQPLGTVAKANDEIIVYVGSPNEKEGTKTNLTLVATQNHGEAAKWQSNLGQLSVGRNVITIPNIATLSVAENGGSLYVAWNGDPDSREYSVRVSGGESIPMLNVAGKSGAERAEEIKKYVASLEEYVPKLKENHDKYHMNKEYRNDCILNYTEIVMNNMMYSVPASQVLSGLRSGGAEQLEKAIDAMEQEVDLFYQHKGYGKNASDAKNKYPSQRLNIRYHTMFTGAFMYAGGQHIGIEYDSVPELFSLSPVTYDERGKKTGGRMTGWGIGHEIGHVINNRNYTVPEVTNNYFAMLATQVQRINYDNVYKVVTKGCVGQGSNVFTKLGMYWQLHMFYDNYYDFKMFDSNEEQLANLFYARVDSYSRNPASAPSNGVDLTLSGSDYDKFMRLACAAAQKNLLSYFEAWGLCPDEETKKYAEQFEKEEHKIQYLNDNAREYRLDGGLGMSSGTKVNAEIISPNNDNVIYDNKVTLSLGNTGNADAMLGYEIIRNGESVAFVTADKTSYTDIITTGNNKVYEYQVIGYDKLLNTTEIVQLSPVKVKHQGEIDRNGWNIETNMSSDADEMIKADDNSGYCEDTYISTISNIIGNGNGDGYNGKVSDGNAEFIISLGKTEQVTAIKYDGVAAGFTVYVSEDNLNWTEVKKGNFKGGKEEVVYFNQPDKVEQDGKGYMYIYEANYVKVVFDSSSVFINDFNILGPTSDNVELLNNGIGKLKTDFVYDKNTGAFIPAGSLVFTGVYKGSPAYNVVKLLDENGNIINGSQIIMAEDPENGELGDVSEGIWIYWIEPKDIPEKLPVSVKAELYRVDNAITLENERLVSDTLVVSVPMELPDINIEGENVSLAEAQISENTEKTFEDSVDNATEIVSEEVNEIINKTENNDELSDDNSEIKIEEESVGAQNLLGSSNITQVNKIVHEISLAAASSQNVDTIMENNISRFIFTNSSDNKKALMRFELGNANVSDTIALQTQFKVSENNVTDVNIDWSDVVSNRAVLKECRFDARKGLVNIYVVANTSLLDNNSITLGDIKMSTKSGIKEASLVLSPDSTVTLSSDFVTQRYSDLIGDVTLSAENLTDSSNNNSGGSETSGGSSGGGGSSKRTSANVKNNDKEDKNDEIKTDDIDIDKDTIIKTDEMVTPEDVSMIFSDVSKNDWFYSSVERAYNKKWFVGTSASEFSPKSAMTRGMFVTVLGRFSDAETVSKTTKFVDVPETAYYSGFVAWAADKGIVSGISDTEFAPEAAITREQLAVMIYNYLNFKNISLEKNEKVEFTDDMSISAWAKDAVYYVQQTGIINGMPDGSFKPKNTAARAEVATILTLLDKKIRR